MSVCMCTAHTSVRSKTRM